MSSAFVSFQSETYQLTHTHIYYFISHRLSLSGFSVSELNFLFGSSIISHKTKSFSIKNFSVKAENSSFLIYNALKIGYTWTYRA